MTRSRESRRFALATVDYIPAMPLRECAAVRKAFAVRSPRYGSVLDSRFQRSLQGEPAQLVTCVRLIEAPIVGDDAVERCH
jgi:hypothetical protein